MPRQEATSRARCLERPSQDSRSPRTLQGQTSSSPSSVGSRPPPTQQRLPDRALDDQRRPHGYGGTRCGSFASGSITAARLGVGSRLTGTVIDSGSGAASSTTSALPCTTTGWTHTPATAANLGHAGAAAVGGAGRERAALVRLVDSFTNDKA